MDEYYEYLKKCVCIGDAGCGKTSIVTTFSQGLFNADYKITIGMDFSTKSIKINQDNGEDTIIKLRIWDIGGNDSFQFIRSHYYKGAHGIILLFDLTRRSSFESLSKWKEEVLKQAGEIPIVLVGNKSDLKDNIIIEEEEVKQYAKKNEMIYIKTSAKNGDNVKKAFELLSQMMIRH